MGVYTETRFEEEIDGERLCAMETLEACSAEVEEQEALSEAEQRDLTLRLAIELALTVEQSLWWLERGRTRIPRKQLRAAMRRIRRTGERVNSLRQLASL